MNRHHVFVKILGLGLVLGLTLAGCRSTEPPVEDIQIIKNTAEASSKPRSSQLKSKLGMSKEKLEMPPLTNPNPGTFSRFTTLDIHGKRFDESVFKSKKLTVLNVWGTFCPPCVHEMPALGRLSKSFATSDVQIIGLVLDVIGTGNTYAEDRLVQAESIIEQTGADYPHLLPSPDLFAAYLNQVQSLPTTLFVDEKGLIQKQIIGARSEADWEALIKQALEQVDHES